MAVALAAFALAGAACGGAAGPASSGAPDASAPGSAAPTASPGDASGPPGPSSDPGATATPAPSPSATAPPSAGPTPGTPRTAAPSPGADSPTPDTFWGLVERGIRLAGRVEVQITGPNAGTLRYEPDASATAIEGVVGYVCLDGRAYDGQSGFTRVPGRWTCGASALVAGFRGIGLPIDAWNSSIPTRSS